MGDYSSGQCAGEPRTGVRGCAICCTAGGNGIRAAQVQTGGLTRSREERGVRGGGAVGLWAFFEYEGSVFWGVLFFVFFSLVLSPPRRTVLVLDLNWNRRGGGFAGCWTHAKPRRETQGAFESLQCGLDQPVVFEPLMGEHKCEPRTRVCGRAFCSTAAGGGIHCARPCTAVPGWPEGSQVTAVQSGVSPIRLPRSGFSIGCVVC